jgi:DNA-directed RNA polymerase alpha subunit
MRREPLYKYDDFDFTVRTFTVLRKNNFKTLKRLTTQFTEEEFRKLPLAGRRVVEELNEYFESKGLSFKKPAP